jgi:hypothetical protein
MDCSWELPFNAMKLNRSGRRLITVEIDNATQDDDFGAEVNSGGVCV